MTPPDMTEAAARLRAMAIQHDNAGHALREIAFRNWLDSTVYGRAVNRWIAELGGRA